MPKTPAQKAAKKAKKAAAKAVVKSLASSAVVLPKNKNKKQKNKQKIMVVSGHGDYTATSKSGKWWSELGGRGADLISQILGNGDYHNTLKRNSVMDWKRSGNIMNAAGPPVFVSKAATTPRGTRLFHREYVADVSGSSGFVTSTYLINPTNATLFPWFSQLAGCFDQFIVHGMIFEYNTLASEVSTASSLGCVIISTQYDVNELPFTSKLQMENYEYTKSSVPTLSFEHGLECDRDTLGVPTLMIGNNTRSGVVADPRFSNLGITTVATSGMPVAGVVGELWVTFDIELVKPRLFPGITTNAYMSFSSNSGISNGNTLGTVVLNLSGTTGIWSGVPTTFNTMAGSTVLGFCYNGFTLPASLAGHSIFLTAYYTGTGFTGIGGVNASPADSTAALLDSSFTGTSSFVSYALPLALRTGATANTNFSFTMGAPVGGSAFSLVILRFTAMY